MDLKSLPICRSDALAEVLDSFSTLRARHTHIRKVATLPPVHSCRLLRGVTRLQLGRLRGDHGFARLSEQLRAIAGLLEEKATIPIVRAQLALILDIQSDEWWQDVTLAMLEEVRKKLRGLVSLIEKKDRRIVYTDFEDEMGTETEIELQAFASAGNLERFRAKAFPVPEGARRSHRHSEGPNKQGADGHRSGRVGADAGRERRRYGRGNSSRQ